MNSQEIFEKLVAILIEKEGGEIKVCSLALEKQNQPMFEMIWEKDIIKIKLLN